MNKNKSSNTRYREIRNKKASHRYFLDDHFEAGIVLTGTEVKSIREGQAQINDAFVRIDKGVPILYHAHIAEYSFGSFANHRPYRPRRLLLKKREILKLEQEMLGGGRTLVPTRMYFKKALVKVEIALARGKKLFDKREDLKQKEAKLEVQRTVRHHL